MHALHPARRAAGALAAALALAGPAAAAEGPQPPAPRDAAEKVQEGNVQNWIEYYQRSRGLPPAPRGPQDGAAAAPPGQPAPTPQATPAPGR